MVVVKLKVMLGFVTSPQPTVLDLVDFVGSKAIDKIKELGVENVSNEDIGNIIWSLVFVKYGRQIFECENCGRLLVQRSDGENYYFSYKPEYDENDDVNERCLYFDKKLSDLEE